MEQKRTADRASHDLRGLRYLRKQEGIGARTGGFRGSIGDQAEPERDTAGPCGGQGSIGEKDTCGDKRGKCHVGGVSFHLLLRPWETRWFSKNSAGSILNC